MPQHTPLRQTTQVPHAAKVKNNIWIVQHPDDDGLDRSYDLFLLFVFATERGVGESKPHECNIHDIPAAILPKTIAI
ncbi:uncharacterized protein PHALS_11815 [Plasmopara halstedii]|uniref:Uncharacterized protein n=1 Tax=Plasmopara halstedii TaxID=4781 RepID=A0A0P1ALI1_PLAHL|nr:uncharacterized protein PHALS_11815 [Plasmopara halstedii]CEG41473.1 hypothetical protein PHALS_11815 [Plasmopara halstedii]|eukprot:XP_024577842.1 hypothetical protein PHALS_11815 [Plasmopara halstedii]